MKLDTLIDDIYSQLSELSEGREFNLSEENLDLTVSRIKDSLLAWARPSDRNAEFSLRMSNVGRPARQLWYEQNLPSETSVPSPSLQIKFLYGHLLEEILLMLVRASGHSVTDEQKEVTVKGVKGHIDCKIDGEVVDIKTASKFSFNKFREGRLREDDPFGYMSQLAGYEEAENSSEGGFLVINKESGELCLYRPEELDKPSINTQIQGVKKALKLSTPPPRCYESVPEGKKGNMKLHRSCTYCSYKFECYKDANNGQGLRVFQYANGPTYLTHVEVAPRVEEIV
tara:strand:- start:2116 stop:2970 length:855 start_codon:yes stop_codon:yes gene_type:complete